MLVWVYIIHESNTMTTSLVPQLINININYLLNKSYKIVNKRPRVEQLAVHLWTVLLFIIRGVR